MHDRSLEPELDRQKLKSVVHYICHQCRPEELGNVKLHKILYFADMLHFMDTGRALTGAKYQKQQFGPVATHLTSALSELVRDQIVEVRTRDYFGFPKTDYVSLCVPPVAALSNIEKQLIEDVIDFVCARTNKEISELSHNEAWHTAAMGETIPYFTVYGWMPGEVTDADLEFATQDARRIAPLIRGDRHADRIQ